MTRAPSQTGGSTLAQQATKSAPEMKKPQKPATRMLYVEDAR